MIAVWLALWNCDVVYKPPRWKERGSRPTLDPERPITAPAVPAHTGGGA